MDIQTKEIENSVLYTATYNHYKGTALWNRTVLFITILILTPIVLWLTATWSRHYALSSIQERSEQTLRLVVGNLQGELTKFQNIPQLLANNEHLKEYLNSPKSFADTIKINIILEIINSNIGALDTYLLNENGLAVAASNWSRPKSFIGRSYHYRPYYLQAIKGTTGQYFAHGTISNEKGYYFSHPIIQNEKIVGVIVVKIKLTHFEERWQSKNHEITVSDRNGIIFLTSQPTWQYRSWKKLTSQEIHDIINSRQYSGRFGRRRFDQLKIRKQQNLSSLGDLIQIHNSTHKRKYPTEHITEPAGIFEYLLQQSILDDVGWDVSILARTDQANRSQTIAILIVSFILLSITFMSAYIVERRRRIAEGIALQEQSRLTLEKRVKERTLDLNKINKKLLNEIHERRQTEAELRLTQKELIQAGRLAAIGKLSAGISHELNQPLAAIRSYADNAREYLGRDNHQAASSNLRDISELTDRIARIIRNLKTYATQDTKDLRKTCIKKAFQEAVSLLDRRLTSQGVQIIQESNSQDLQAIAGDIRLQQVFVNLITNSLDAMTNDGNNFIKFSMKEEQGHVVVSLKDTGSGISENDLSHIFDPFYTTKEVGEGLGLGLSITFGIIRQFGGTIEAHNDPEGGAIFQITLLKEKEGT